MRKSSIDHLLEAAVAKALHVSLPRQQTPRPARRAANGNRRIKHAA
jgi:hypothetical protein